jgi:hypothetical protein
MLALKPVDNVSIFTCVASCVSKMFPGSSSGRRFEILGSSSFAKRSRAGFAGASQTDYGNTYSGHSISEISSNDEAAFNVFRKSDPEFM